MTSTHRNGPYYRFAMLATVLTLCVVVLGDYVRLCDAGSGCPDFPVCRPRLWFPHHFARAFSFALPIGIDYRYGILSSATRATVHMAHRYGALLSFVAMAEIAFYLMAAERAAARDGVIARCLPSSVYRHQPDRVAASFVLDRCPQWGAALLLLTVIGLNHVAWKAREPLRTAGIGS